MKSSIHQAQEHGIPITPYNGQFNARNQYKEAMLFRISWFIVRYCSGIHTHYHHHRVKLKKQEKKYVPLYGEKRKYYQKPTGRSVHSV